jgi:hypothetical protein
MAGGQDASGNACWEDDPLSTMLNRLGLIALLLSSSFAPLAAHHGWGSYDATKPLTVAGPILTSKFENPHVILTVESPGKVWTLTLAPPSRMLNRGALAELVAVGNTVSAYGYPSTAQADEMRAERITVGGKTIEMR